MIPRPFRSLPETRRLEVDAAIYFIAAQRRLMSRWLTVVDMPSPPEPDFLVRLGRDLVGLEVAHIFGSERDARLLLGRSQAHEQTREARLDHSTMPVNVRLREDLARVLNKKASKRYPRPTLLALRNTHPVWGGEACLDQVRGLVIPSGHRFSEIWLVCDPWGKSGLLQLYPYFRLIQRQA
jgi:hypothetical protein